jgi:N-methylhydantoinase A
MPRYRVLSASSRKILPAAPPPVEEYDATCLVPPGAHAALDRFGNIIIDL